MLLILKLIRIGITHRYLIGDRVKARAKSNNALLFPKRSSKAWQCCPKTEAALIWLGYFWGYIFILIF